LRTDLVRVKDTPEVRGLFYPVTCIPARTLDS
jgi:hypothetical protein